MSTLYIRPPCQFAAPSRARWVELPCRFALAAREGAIEREGVASFAELCATAAAAQRVVLLLAASDVSLLRVQVPPLPTARLKDALPNMVEDSLLADPCACAVVAGGLHDGLRSVAVVQRDWLEFLAGTLLASGARKITALPAQLCLPLRPDQPGGACAAVGESGAGLEITLRLAEQQGVGVALAPDLQPGEESARHAAWAREALHSLRALAPQAPLTLYVPQALLRAYQEAASHGGGRIEVLADNWALWIAGARNAAPDLLAGSGMAAGRALDWRAWRWPVALAAAVLLVNAVALNAQWWRMQSEAAALRASMVQIYKSAYPDETVILDPAAQMQQKISMARQRAGQPAPDDFTALLAAFGEAWSRAMPGSLAIAALEYRERSLVVRLKPGADVQTQQLQTALAERRLALEALSAQPAVWKIRSAP